MCRQDQQIGRRVKSQWPIQILGIALTALLMNSCGGGFSTSSADASWLQGSGTDLHNTRLQPLAKTIRLSNVAELAPKWVAVVGGDVSATPTTDGVTVYFPDWGGTLNALRSATGEVAWQKPISSYNGVMSYSRTSPAIVDGGTALIIGDIAAVNHVPGPGASVMKIDARTGERIWITKVET